MPWTSCGYLPNLVHYQSQNVQGNILNSIEHHHDVLLYLKSNLLDFWKNKWLIIRCGRIIDLHRVLVGYHVLWLIHLFFLQNKSKAGHPVLQFVCTPYCGIYKIQVKCYSLSTIKVLLTVVSMLPMPNLMLPKDSRTRFK